MIKVTLIGGSSPSTPALLRALGSAGLRTEIELWLLGRDAGALGAVATAGDVLLAGSGVKIATCSLLAADWPAAVEGADIVVLQVRAGGYQGRTFDETFPLAFGLCGDEGLGPGGLSAGVRNWPLLQEYLKVIRVWAPRAHVLLLTSPVGVLTRVALDQFPELNISGICELPWTTLRGVCHEVHAEVSRVDFDYLGVNHLGWFSRLAFEGRDLISEYRENRHGVAFPDRRLIDRCGGVPLKYVRLDYESMAIVSDQRAQLEARGQVLERYRERALSAFRSTRVEDITRVLDLRPAEWYQYAVAPYIFGRAAYPVSVPLFLTQRNDGYYPDLGACEVLEIPQRFQGGKLVRLPLCDRPPQHIRDFVDDVVVYERWAAKALIQPNPQSVAEALAKHPWLISMKMARAMADEILGFRPS